MFSAPPGATWQLTGYGQIEQSIALSGGAWTTIGSGLSVPQQAQGFGLVSGQRVSVTDTTRSEFADGMTRAIGSLTSDVKASLAASNLDVALMADGLEAAINATGNQPILADVVTQLMSGDADIGTVVKGVIVSSVSIAAAAASMPVVGTLVAIVFLLAEKASIPRMGPAQVAALDKQYLDYCRDFTRRRPVGTDENNQVSPADLFAQRDPRAEAWKWLCGGASRDVKVRADYAKWFSVAKGKYNITGIPISVQKSMVALMEGIFAARRNPEPQLKVVPVGDNGRSLFPILAQITIDQYPKAWTLGSLKSLVDNFIAPAKTFYAQSGGLDVGIVAKKYPPCSRGFTKVDIGQALYNMLVDFEENMRDSNFRAEAELAVASLPPPKSTLILSPVIAKKLALIVKSTQRISASAAEVEANNRKAAIATTAVVLGAGAFYLARRYAKKRRGR